MSRVFTAPPTPTAPSPPTFTEAAQVTAAADATTADATYASDAALAATTIAGAAEGLPTMNKVIVAIHGIGSQLRSDTIRSVARRFGDRSDPPLPVMPLGYFNIGKTAEVRISRLEADADDPLAAIGFAEIFWADIPGEIVAAEDTLEETRAWGRTVVSRAQAAYRKNVPHGKLTAEDFELGAGVLEEVVETVDVLESLTAVAAKAGVFKFELGALLRDFVGDVQIVTDFPFHRERILYRFHRALAQVLQGFRDIYPGQTPEIYIVAHSEGTVISWLGLLQAMSGKVVTDPESTVLPPVPVDGSWIGCVRGFMTIGSPIDKHIVLWPRLWDGLKLQSRLDANGGVVFDGTAGRQRLRLDKPIPWRNYYDHGDPVGFQLDTASALLHERGCVAFEFGPQHDFGFSRYWLPGKAHTDYWQDADVFGHFIEDVVLPTGKARAPKGSLLVDRVSMLIPYLLTMLIHLAAVFVLYKVVTLVPDGPVPMPMPMPSQALVPGAVDPTAAGPAVSRYALDGLPLQVALLSGLLASITVASRLPRLVRTDGVRWHVAATLAFLSGAVPCVWLLPPGPTDFIGGPISGLVGWFDLTPPRAAAAALVVAAAIIAVSGWLVPRRPKLGRRLLIGFGTALIAFVVVQRLADGTSQAPVWPLLLAGVAFLYLWWLGILMFDLTFVWHRYIRRSVAVQTLRDWHEHRDACAAPFMGLAAEDPPKTAVADRRAP